MRALLALLLCACQAGELIVPAKKTTYVSAINATTLYALSIEGEALRVRTASLEKPVVPVTVATPMTLSDVAFASSGAGYFVVDHKILRVLGFENSLTTLIDVDVPAASHVATTGTQVFISTKMDGLVSIDETSSTTATVDFGVSGPIVADADWVYFEQERKLRRTSRMNGSRDPMFELDIPAGLTIKSITRAGDRFLVGGQDAATGRNRAIYAFTAVGVLQKTTAVANESSPIVADGEHAYFCAAADDVFGRMARVPLQGGTVQYLVPEGISDCPFAVDPTHLYFYASDGLRRLKKSEIPRP